MARSPHGVRWLIALLAAVCLAWIAPADASAQGRGRSRSKPARKQEGRPGKDKDKDKDKGEVKVFDFTGLDIAGQLRTPQLLYFLDRANEELERASLERRSFIPEMVRSIDEETL